MRASVINTFGIDYQQTLSVVCLREGRGPDSMMRSVGDGQRAVFPNAAAVASAEAGQAGQRLWASEALAQAGAEQVWRGGAAGGEADGRDNPGALQFWQGLRARLKRYLGRDEPTRSNGYRILIALAGAEAQERAMVRQLAETAGLDISDTDFLTSSQAVLCRWIAHVGRVDQEQTLPVVVVAVGDAVTEVAACQVRALAGEGVYVTTPLASPRIVPFGHAHWSGELRACLNQRLPEPLPARNELALRDACLEFAACLRAQPPGECLAWHGPGHSRLNPPLELELQDCLQWTSAQEFTSLLVPAIGEAMKTLGAGGKPGLIVVGGVGAVWPFAAHAARLLAPVWQSSVPQEDIARGAAWWPELYDRLHANAVLLPAPRAHVSVPRLPAATTTEHTQGEAACEETSASDSTPARLSSGTGAVNRLSAYPPDGGNLRDSDNSMDDFASVEDLVSGRRLQPQSEPTPPHLLHGMGGTEEEPMMSEDENSALLRRLFARSEEEPQL